MKHPVLFDVPKSHPSRKQRLDEFKAKHGIETHYCREVEYQWMALHLPTVRKIVNWLPAETPLVGYIAEYGMRLEDSGLVREGQTEREVVEAACIKAGITFDP